MSRSFKRAIYKDRGIGGKCYRRTVKRSQANSLRSNIWKLLNDMDYALPDEQEIINDYDRCDYQLRYDFRKPKFRDKLLKKHEDEWTKKLRRK